MRTFVRFWRRSRQVWMHPHSARRPVNVTSVLALRFSAGQSSTRLSDPGWSLACLCAILEVPQDTCGVVTSHIALSFRGLCLRSAERTKVANWTDVLPMIPFHNSGPNGATHGRGIVIANHASRQPGSGTVGGIANFAMSIPLNGRKRNCKF